MNLKELQRELSTAHPNLSISASTIISANSINGGQAYSLTGLKRFRIAIENIESLGVFVNQIQKIKASVIFASASDNAFLDEKEHNTVWPAIQQLKYGIEGLISSLPQIVGADDPNAVLFKLPESDDLKEIAKSLDDFHKILSQTVLHSSIGGEIKVKGVLSGSIWFQVLLGSLTAVSVVGSLFWSAAVILKKFKEAQMFEEHARGLGIKNESLKELVDAQKKASAIMLEAEAKQLYAEHYKEDYDPEQIERIKHSIELMVGLIQKGAEVHPSLNAPEQVANLFPKVADLSLIESRIKKIDNL